MKMYDIIKLENSEYDSLIIICNTNSPVDYLSSIYSELRKKQIKGKIIIDEILHVGNTNKRFMSFDFDINKPLEEINLEFVNINKGNYVRKVSCQYLKNNDLVESSILSSIQKRMIGKGIAI